MNTLKEIEKIIPDFRQYYLDWEFKERNIEIAFSNGWEIKGGKNENIKRN